MKTLKTTLIALFVGATFLTSCSKPEDGATGPQGATGLQGATGTANVIYSDWIPAPATIDETIDNTSGKSVTINAPDLTQDILDKGTILVYAKFSSTVFQLPYTSTAGGSVNTMDIYPSLQKIKIFRFKHDGTGGLGFNITLRYILIPGGVSATKPGARKTNLKAMSYTEVCQMLHIPE